MESKHAPVLLFGALFTVVLGIYAYAFPWQCINFHLQVQDLAAMLAPLAFAATVVERAVEILISPWRDEQASKLAKIVAAALTPEAKKDASDKLDEYRGTTQRIAFFVSIFVSTCLSISGVRALQPFLDADEFKALATTHPYQQTFFLVVDVGLSTAMLSGGADGVHSAFTAVTSFFDASATKSGAAADKTTTSVQNAG
jgi:hypothetical protein